MGEKSENTVNNLIDVKIDLAISEIVRLAKAYQALGNSYMFDKMMYIGSLIRESRPKK